MTEQQKERVWNVIQKIKNPDIRYEREFEFLRMHGTVTSILKLENELITVIL